jgi:Bap31/Bap29 transmembrane region
MASIVWMSIFSLLVVELIIVLILCLPTPRKIRNVIAREIFKLNLENALRKPMLGLGIALGLALMESFFTHQRIMTRLYDNEQDIPHHHHHTDRFYPNLHDKERKYKSERNMYLVGFALTLLFAIGRLTALLQESVELHDEMDRLSQQKQTQKQTKNKETETKTETKKES